MNGYTRDKPIESKPLIMVCDDAFLHVTQSASPALVSINLAQWLCSDQTFKESAHFVLCDSIDLIEQARIRDPSIYIVALVDHLKDANIEPMLNAGADDIITEPDFASGRLGLMLSQRQNQQAMIDRHVAVAELTQSFYSAANLGELIDSVCKSLLCTFNAKHVAVCKLAHDEAFTLLAEWQRSGDNIKRANFTDVELLRGSTSQCYGRNKLVRRGVADERDSTVLNKARKLVGIGCSITLPLIQDDLVWGVLVLEKDKSEKDFNDVELSLLELLTAQMSNSILRQNLLDEIHFQAFHDSLTQLPNRLNFENALKQAVASNNAEQEKFALLFLDLDGFKGVNDNQGHSVGDELLKQVSKRLAGCLQEQDLLARMGGDEFAVLLRGVKSRDSALAIAMRLSEVVGEVFIIDKYNLKIGVSVGLSFYPDNGETVDDLLRNADFAMYEAKSDGNGAVRSFNQSMAKQFRERIALEQNILSAIENDQFELYYQPKVDIVQGRVSGVEALLRWNHPELGSVSPDEFVTVAKEAGFITAIGNWVLDEAIGQTALWNADSLQDLKVAVNISGPQFVLEDFVEGVFAMLKHHNLHPTQLELEVQESVIMNNLTKVVDTLNTLRAQGITIAVDDFGRGYSSLAYLELLPLDCMKIDNEFVDKLVAGNEQYSVVNSILTMARSFGLKAIAEGVESKDQLQKLSALGCECVQGYYFSKPVPAAQIPAIIESIEHQFDDHLNANPDEIFNIPLNMQLKAG